MLRKVLSLLATVITVMALAVQGAHAQNCYTCHTEWGEEGPIEISCESSQTGDGFECEVNCDPNGCSCGLGSGGCALALDNTVQVRPDGTAIGTGTAEWIVGQSRESEELVLLGCGGVLLHRSYMRTVEKRLLESARSLSI